MILSTYEAKKLEAFTDIFKGTCELNGFDIVKVSGDYSLNELKSINPKGKVYYVDDEEGKVKLHAINFSVGTYDLAEMVNMVVRALYNADLMEVTVLFNEKAKETFEPIIEDLEMLEIPCGFAELKASKGDILFEVRIDDNVVGGGCVYKDEYIEIYIDYEQVKEYYEYREEDSEIDAYVIPASKDVLSDAFVISSNLKDAGLRVQVDYTMGEEQLGNSVFLIDLDAKLIASYKVKLTDRKTHEVRELSIDDLAEALLFI